MWARQLLAARVRDLTRPLDQAANGDLSVAGGLRAVGRNGQSEATRWCIAGRVVRSDVGVVAGFGVSGAGGWGADWFCCFSGVGGGSGAGGVCVGAVVGGGGDDGDD